MALALTWKGSKLEIKQREAGKGKRGKISSHSLYICMKLSQEFIHSDFLIIGDSCKLISDHHWNIVINSWWPVESRLVHRSAHPSMFPPPSRENESISPWSQ